MKTTRWILSTILILSAAAAAFGQTAQMTGLITDSSKAAMAGVKVTVTNAQTGVSRATASNVQGNYTVPLLPPGKYQVLVQADGFRPISREGITLEVDQVARLDFSMEVGAVTESISVTAQAPLLQTSSGSLGQVIESKQFTDMPLNDRGALGLLSLSDGIAPSRSQDPNSFNNSNAFSANGSRPGQNEILLDGAPNTVPGVWPGRGILGTPIQVDAVQEFKVQTSIFSAEYGRTSGGLVNMVTRSGGNAWHGSASQYLRNSAMDANDFFNNLNGIPLTSFKRNQFGGTFSGPLSIPKVYSGKNRTFFFANYQGTRASVAQSRITTVPSAAMRTGDFSQLVTLQGQPVIIYDPLSTTTVGGTPTRQPFAGNRIPGARIDPVAKNLAAYFPLPNASGPVNNLAQATASRQTADIYGIRVDHAISSRQNLFVRFTQNRDDGLDPKWLDSAAQGSIGLNQKVNSIAADYTYTLNATSVLNLHYGFTNRRHDSPDPALGMDLTTLGFPKYVNSEAKLRVFPSVSTSGYMGMGNGQGVNAFFYRTQSFQASVIKVKGAHTLKAGADLRFNTVNQERGIDPSGTYSFSRAFTQGPNANKGGATVGDAFASLLLGTPASGQLGTAVNPISYNPYYALYLQDDWKVSSKLTLNLGLRYDIELPRYEENNQLDWFDYNALSPLNGKVAGAGQLRGGLRFARVDGNPRRHFNTDAVNFAPRFGFAYQVNPKTVVRGGAGVFFAPGSIGAGGWNIASQAFAPSTSFVGSLDGLTPIQTLSNPFPNGFSATEGSSQGLMSQVGQVIARIYDRDAPLAYHVQWSFSVQRQVGKFALQAAYSANHGVHLADGAGFNINQLRPETLSLGSALQQLVPNPFFGIITAPGQLRAATVTRGQLLRPYPQFDNLTVFNPAAGSSIYHGMSVKAERRFANGVGVLASWTVSKNISDCSATLGQTVAHQNAYNRRASRSLVEADIPQRVVSSLSYELPIGKGKRIGANWNRAGDLLLGGWQVNTMILMQSGFPLALTNSPNTANALGGTQRPNSRGFNASLTGRTQDRLNAFVDAKAFSAPDPFTYGNVGRTLPDVRGPRLSNMNLSLLKTFALTEKLKLQFRAEAFNLANSPMFGMPNQSFGSAAFGTITSTQNTPRQLQLALRLFF
jgi:hypothetical protein